MFSSRSRLGSRALGCPQPLGDTILGEASTGACLEHLVGNTALEGKRRVRLDELLAGCHLGKTRSVRVADGTEPGAGTGAPIGTLSPMLRAAVPGRRTQWTR